MGHVPPQRLQNVSGIESTAFTAVLPATKSLLQKDTKGFSKKVLLTKLSGNKVLLTKRFSKQALLTKLSDNQVLVTTQLATKFCLQNSLATKFLLQNGEGVMHPLLIL